MMLDHLDEIENKKRAEGGQREVGFFGLNQVYDYVMLHPSPY
jgi:hypothetical protein